jgi:hypothetical protein
MGISNQNSELQPAGPTGRVGGYVNFALPVPAPMGQWLNSACWPAQPKPSALTTDQGW